MIKILNQIFTINKIIQKKKIKTILFVDSYGGISHFFLKINNLKKKDKPFLIISNNISVYKNFRKLKIFKENIFFFKFLYNDFTILNYFKLIFLFWCKFFLKKVEHVFSYKLLTDPSKYLLINIFSNAKTKILINDQFIESYIFNLEKQKKLNIFFKKLILLIINFFFHIKLNLYLYLDQKTLLYPSLNKKFHKKKNISITNNLYKNFYKNNFKIKTNSTIFIDNFVDVINQANLIDYKTSKHLIENSINKFLKEKNINTIYFKKHPTRKNSLFFHQLKLNARKIYIKNNFPIELILRKFKFIIFSITSSIYYAHNKNIYSFFKKIIFKRNIDKKNYVKLIKKNSGKNFKKINYL
jgi:hypothetical protein